MDTRLNEVVLKMQKAVEIISADFSSIRTGRASPSLIENIVVSAYEGTQKLKIMEMGTINAPDAKTLLIQPWDATVVSDIAKAILEANIGLNPTIDSNLIRISFPPLTEERRNDFIKLLKQKIEAGKVMIRQQRHDMMAELKRGEEKNEITEDDRKYLENELQKLTDDFVSQIEELGKKKEEELTKI